MKTKIRNTLLGLLGSLVLLAGQIRRRGHERASRHDRYPAAGQGEQLQSEIRPDAADRLPGRTGRPVRTAFAHDPITLPSHANILLGMTSLAHGVANNSLSIVPGGLPPWPNFSKAADTQRALSSARFPWIPVSAWIRVSTSTTIIIRQNRLPEGLFSERPAEKTIAAALRWIWPAKGPWFCWIHLWDPHAPYAAPEPFASQVQDRPYSAKWPTSTRSWGASGRIGRKGRIRPDCHRADGRPRRISGRARRDDPRLFRLQLDALGAPHHLRPGGGSRPGEGLRQPRRYFPDRLRSARGR